MKWLITGGCGFLGTALVKRLVTEGNHSIRIIDNLSTGTREDLAAVTTFIEVDKYNLNNLPVGVELLVGDIADDLLALDAACGCDVIVHFAANTGVEPSVRDPRKDMLANVVGTFNYLEAARLNRVSRFIFASSGASVGEVEPPIHEEVPPHPVSPYGSSKLAGEAYCSSYKRSFDVDTVALRFGNVYGPGSVHKSSVVAKFIRQALAGELLEIFGDGTQTRDFIYIDDLIDAVLLSVYAPDIGGQIFQIASGNETTIGEIGQRLVNQLKLAGVSNVRLANAKSRAGDVKRNFSDATKAKNFLGWQPKNNLDDGLQKTISYFIS